MAAFILVIAATTAILDFSTGRAWENSFRAEIERNLEQKTWLFANRVNTENGHSLQDIVAQESHAAGARATVIDSSGKVLADSETSTATENYGQFPEFASALRGEVGRSVRRSQTLGIPSVFVAVPITGGAVRLAYSLSDVEEATSNGRTAFLWGSAIAFLFALLIAALAAQYTSRRLQRILQFAERIAAGDLAARIDESSIDEIGQLAAALDKTARHLEANFAALQTSQHQLETLLNSMEDAVVAVGPDERVMWANHSMDTLVPQRTRLNAPVVETVRDPDFLRAVRGASGARTVFTARATSILPGRTFDVTAAPMPAGGAVAVIRDLTETERVEKTRRDFIANVSHELRTPLTSIQGYAETLLDTSSDGNHTREFLEIIRKNASRMSRLTEDLLTLARVESGEQRFRVQEIPASQLIHEAQQYFGEMAHSRGSELSVDLSNDAAVKADPEAVHQVFSNLISNAVKYCPPGTPIVIGAQEREDNLEFFVRDAGPGIASEHLPRLFQRFYRVDKARSRESGGTGLGLAIVKHIVLAHGGSVRVESELNHGSTFFFTLPRAQSSAGSIAGSADSIISNRSMVHAPEFTPPD